MRPGQAQSTPKQGNGEGIRCDLSPYEWILHFYAQLQEAHHWTPAQIGAIEIAFLFDQLAVQTKVKNAPKRGYIDDLKL